MNEKSDGLETESHEPTTIFACTEYSGSEDENEGELLRKREYSEYAKPTIQISFPLEGIDLSAQDYMHSMADNTMNLYYSADDDSEEEAENTFNLIRKFEIENRRNKNISPYLQIQPCECKEILISSPETIITEIKKLGPNKSVGETLLHVASRKNLRDICLYLVHSLEYKDNLNVKENAGYTALHEACLALSYDCVKLLLKHGANPNCALPDGTRPIHDAIDIDDIELVKTLISFGSDPTLKTYIGKTCLEYAKSNKMRDFLQKYINMYDAYTHNVPKFDEETLKCIHSLVEHPNSLKNHSTILYEVSDEPFPPAYNISLNGKKFNVVLLPERLSTPSELNNIKENDSDDTKDIKGENFVLLDTYINMPDKKFEVFEIEAQPNL